MSASKTRHWIQTAESVTAGHADKICDLIADDILDAVLTEDRYARVSCEVMATTGMVIVTGQSHFFQLLMTSQNNKIGFVKPR